MSVVIIREEVPQVVPHEVLFLRLRVPTLTESVQASLSAIINSLNVSRIIPESARIDIQEWYTAFTSTYLPALGSDEERKTAGLSICFLICELMQPVIISQKDNLANLEILFKFEDDLKELIRKLLPPNGDVEALIKTFKDSAKEEDRLLCDLIRIDLCYQKNIKAMCENFNKAEKELQEKNFETLKKRFQAFTAQQQVKIKGLQTRIDELKRKFQLIEVAQANTSKAITETGNQLKTQLVGSVQVLQKASNLINSVKTNG